MLNIIYSTQNDYKSSYMYSLALENIKKGGLSILIVPEQEAVSAERKIYKMSGDTPLLGLEVMNFDKLAETVFRKCGSGSLKYVTDSTKKLILAKTLADLSPALSEFSSRHDDPAFVCAMLAQITEFKYAEISAQSLARVSKKLSENPSEESGNLIQRLNELSLIYASYNTLLSGLGADSCDSLSKSAQLIRTCKPFGNTKIYFDSFNGFTAQEFDIISALLATSADVTVSLLHPGCDADELFAFTEATSLSLIRCAEYAGCKVAKTVLPEADTEASESIRHIARHFSACAKPEKFTGKSDVSVISCADTYDECEVCAALISADIRSGKRYRDISVVVRNTDTYKGVIDEALERYSIPCFFSDKTDICEKSLIKFIFSALSIIKNRARYTDIITHLRCGLSNLSDHEIDLLESYASTWKVSGKIWYSDEGFTMNPRGYMPLTESDASALEKINQIRINVVTQLEVLKNDIQSAKTVADYSRAVYSFTESSDVCSKLARRAKLMQEHGESVLALEEAGLWKAFCASLDQLVLALGGHECNLDEYINLFRLVLADTDIGTIPQSDDVVTIGDASLIRAHDIKNTYMLGCTEGQFPKSTSVPGLLSFEERAKLAQNDLESIAFDPVNEASGELFHFYTAACSGSKKLTLTYPRKDTSGNDCFPSSALIRIFNMFDTPLLFGSDIEAYKKIVNESSFVEHLPYLKNFISGEKINQLILKYPLLKEKTEHTTPLFCENDNKLSKDTVKLTFPADLSISQSASDQYSNCPFSFQCKYSLKLNEKVSSSIRAADIGTLIHSILDDFMQNEFDGIIDADNGVDSTEIYNRIHKITERRSKLILEFTSEEKRPRIARMLERIADITSLTASNLAEEFAQSGFKPTFFEFPISSQSRGGLLPVKLKLEDGSYVLLNGIADRIDTLVKAGKLYVRVVDYKTGDRAFSIESIRAGLSLQLLIYLFSIWENANVEFKTTAGAPFDCEVLPAGAEYLITTPDYPNEKGREDYTKSLEKAFRRSGIYLADPEIIVEMDKGFTQRYVPVKSDMKVPKDSMLASIDEFNSLKDEISSILTEIGNGIKNGNASIDPILILPGKKYGACHYCSMKPVCRKVIHTDIDPTEE